MHVFKGQRGGVYLAPKDSEQKGGFGKVYDAHILFDTPFLSARSEVIVKHALTVTPESRADVENRLENLTMFGGYLPGPEECAQKQLPICFFSPDTEARAKSAAHRQRLVIESYDVERRVLEGVSHPNIVRLHDYGTSDGMPFIVEERCPGHPLDSGVFTFINLDSWRTFAAGLLDAVSALHTAGFVHNDIDEANIMFDGKLVKLIDFGSCVTFEEARTGFNRGFRKGHNSHELLMRSPYDHRSDIYAASSLLLCLKNYRMPGFNDTLEPILRKTVDEKRFPERRHPSAGALKAELLSAFC